LATTGFVADATHADFAHATREPLMAAQHFFSAAQHVALSLSVHKRHNRNCAYRQD
jgi:hypothetical protein